MSIGPYQNLTLFPIAKFDGGLNTKNNPTKLPLNQSPDLLNVDFDDYGAVASCNGYGKLNTAAIGSAAIDGLANFSRNDASGYLVAICSASAYYYSAPSFEKISASSGVFTKGTPVDTVSFRNNLFMSDGVNQPYKWNGAQFTKMGVSAPSGALTAVSTATGVLTRTYQYVYTGVNSNLAESDFGIASTAVTAASASMLVSSIPTAPALDGIDRWNIYRNTAAAGGVYYLVTSVTNGTSSLTDNVADTELGAEAPIDNANPRRFKYMISHQGRLFCAGESANRSYLWYSELNQPEVFPTTNFLRIGEGDGQLITGIAIHYNSVVISKSDARGNTSTWILLTQDDVGALTPDLWYLVKSPSPWGSESHKALVNFDNYLMMMNKDGFFAFQNNETIKGVSQTTTGGIFTDSQSNDIEPDVLSFKTSLLSGVAGINWKNKIWYAVPSTSATKNDVVYKFDYLRASGDSKLGAWSKANMAISRFCVFDNKLYGGSSAENGFIYELDTGHNYDGATIDSYYVTSAISGKEEHKDYYKKWRYVYILFETVGVWNMQLSYFNDFDTGSGDAVNVDLDPGGSLWGAAIWGIDKWGGNNQRKKIRVPLKNSTSRYLQLKFSTNAIDKYFKVHELGVAYTLRGRRS